jgi:hypothetical protein
VSVVNDLSVACEQTDKEAATTMTFKVRSERRKQLCAAILHFRVVNVEVDGDGAVESTLGQNPIAGEIPEVPFDL